MRGAAIALAVAGALLGSGAARAAGPWYVTGSLGGYFREDTQFTAVAVGNPSITGPGTRSYDPGPIVSLGIGYHLPHGFRVESEFSYIDFTVAETKASSATSTSRWPRPCLGHLSILCGTISARPMTGTTSALSACSTTCRSPDRSCPYVGGGIGGAHEENVSATTVDQFGHTFHFVGGESTRGVGLIEAGFTMKVSDRLSVVPAYRWMRFFGGGGTDATEAAHIAKIGLRYAF